MNHLNIYNAIIENAKTQNRKKKNNYYENHHILPKCLGGIDENNNLVLLTAKEHYLCHRLLTYIYPANRKIALAFFYMTHTNTHCVISLRDYAYAKELNAKYTWNRGLTKETNEILKKQGEKRSQQFKDGKINVSNFGKKTKEGLKNISLAQKGKKKSEQHKQKIKNSLKGRKLSEETKQRMKNNSQRGKKQKILTCPYCKKTGGTTMYRWHFENCKFKNI